MTHEEKVKIQNEWLEEEERIERKKTNFYMCRDGKGFPQNHYAQGWLVSPSGRRISAQCFDCAMVVINEYAEKLGEKWIFDCDMCRPYGKPGFVINANQECHCWTCNQEGK